ncbi:response regulator [Oceanobacillus timonensis]|uniref:response regulator n=1 Tax=Oceanobacillus timonensis TaxID=1926285 RepID=UPI0009BC6F7E|nr:response regulator [Oceanobacillus timonensis]
MIQILIVEDDYRIAEIHSGFIEHLDDVNLVGKALNGKEAIAFANKYTIDLVILDLYIPDISGLEILEELRKIQSDMDAIIISAASEKNMIQRTVRRGVFDYMIKPIKQERLIESMKRYQLFNERFNNEETISQHFLDNHFGLKRHIEVEEQRTPKGIDPLTLNKIKKMIDQTEDGVAAEKMGENIGVSRTTARRYLEYLTSLGEIKADLAYGAVGRPERRYYRI